MSIDTLTLSREIGHRIMIHRENLKLGRPTLGRYLAGRSHWSNGLKGVAHVLKQIEGGTLLQRMHRMPALQRDKIRNRIIDYLAALDVRTEYEVYELLDGIHSLYAGFRYRESDVEPYQKLDVG